MPTGYTAKLYDGEAQTFEEFVLRCARGMGALVTLRDEPMDAPIPEEFKPSSYHDTALEAARERMRELDSMTVEQAELRALADYEAEVERRADDAMKRRAMRERYEAMLERVEAWEPPTADHVNLKKFMADQLRESIDFDTRGFDRQPPQLLDGQAWIEAQRADAERDLTYHAAEREKEIERARGRTAWVNALRESLKEPANA